MPDIPHCLGFTDPTPSAVLHTSVVVPFPEELAQAPEATRVRSTLLVSSIGALRRRDLLTRWSCELSAEDRASLEDAVAGTWLPISLGLSHYRACDALGLDRSEQAEIGAEVVRELQRTFLGTLLRLSAGLGVTPWVGLEKFSQIYVRMFVGGGVRIVRLGPKEARADVVGLPLAAIAYFRNAYRGFIQAGCEFFSPHVFVTEIPHLCRESRLGFRISWV